MEIVRKNLERLMDPGAAATALTRAYDSLGLPEGSELDAGAAEDLAQYFIDRGGAYSFVGRSLKIHLSMGRVKTVIREMDR